MKITEKELSKAVKRFKDKNVILKISGLFEEVLKVKNLKINYTYKKRFFIYRRCKKNGLF